MVYVQGDVSDVTEDWTKYVWFSDEESPQDNETRIRKEKIAKN